MFQGSSRLLRFSVLFHSYFHHTAFTEFLKTLEATKARSVYSLRTYQYRLILMKAAAASRRVGSKLVGIFAAALAVIVALTLTLTLIAVVKVNASVNGEENGGISLHPNLRRPSFHWSRNCPSPSVFGFGLEHGADSNSNGENTENADCCCSITDYGVRFIFPCNLLYSVTVLQFVFPHFFYYICSFFQNRRP